MTFDLFSKNIESLRKKKGLSIEELALKANMKISTLNAIRRKAVNDIQLFKTAIPLADALEVDLYEIITDELPQN